MIKDNHCNKVNHSQENDLTTCRDNLVSHSTTGSNQLYSEESFKNVGLEEKYIIPRKSLRRLLILRSHLIGKREENIVDMFCFENDWKSATWSILADANKQALARKIYLTCSQSNIVTSKDISVKSLSKLLKIGDLDSYDKILVWKSISKLLLNEKKLLEYENCLKEMIKIFTLNIGIMWMLIDLYLNSKYVAQLEKQTKSRHISQQSYKQCIRERYLFALEMIDYISKEIDGEILSRLLSKRDRVEIEFKLKEYKAIAKSHIAENVESIEESKKLITELIDTLRFDRKSEKTKIVDKKIAHLYQLLSQLSLRQGKFIEAIGYSEKCLYLVPNSPIHQNRHFEMLKTFEKFKQDLQLLGQLPESIQNNSAEKIWLQICSKIGIEKKVPQSRLSFFLT